MLPTELGIGTLRLHAAADTPALRLAVARELGNADLTPPGLPPAALLVVRRIDDPLPGHLGRPGALRPPREWQSAVRASLDDLARRAARPDGCGELPADAPAVLFADEAEMLACWALDLIRHATHRWWWRSLRHLPSGIPSALSMSGVGSGSSSELRRVWSARPRQLPAIVEQLARWRGARRVLQALDREDACALLATLVDEGMAPAAIQPPRRYDAGRDQVAGRDGPLPRHGSLEAHHAIGYSGPPLLPTAEPWHDWLPDELRTVSLAPEVRCLAGVALTLQAAPHRVTSHFARRVERWWHQVERHHAVEASPLDTSLTSAREKPETHLGTPPHPDGMGGDVPRSKHPSGEPRSTQSASQKARAPLSDDPESVAETIATRSRQDREPASPSERRRRLSVIETSESTDVDPPRQPADALPVDEPVAPTESEQAVEPSTQTQPQTASFEDGVVTAWGGVLYLIHAMDELDLPACFEDDWQLATTAGTWGTLDLLAHGLLASRFPGAASDPLWEALSSLAGWHDARRPVIEPDFRLPVEWWPKLTVKSARLRWASRGRRLLLASEDDFLLADVMRNEATAAEQARQELRRLGVESATPRRTAFDALAPPQLTPLPAGCPSYLGAWVAAVVPAIRHRLSLALGVDAESAHRAIEELLAVPARLHLTSSHVDLVMHLDHISVAARAAGLDRDPGWRPDLGRVVLFHFQ